MKDLINLSGRLWPSSQEDSSILKQVKKMPAIENDRCNRCGSPVTDYLPNKVRYCRGCIEIGRITEEDQLCYLPDLGDFPKTEESPLTWLGKLTQQQEKVSAALAINFACQKNTLVHAVTGAGKTEMLFHLIETCLMQGKRACITTPRIDVVNELFPRFQSAFKKVQIGKYHGREFKEPQYEQLTICTTHQLMKFYHAFDLLVIDEVDSFPYANNKQLHFAAKNAVKENGMRVYLTATPTEDLLAEAQNGNLQVLTLNRRFYGGLLPVPKEKLFFKPFLHKQGINPNLLSEIYKAIAAGHPLLLFVPRIEETTEYLNFLLKDEKLKKIKMASVHASDPNRLQKVADFRENKIDLLVTTTILERGVTFKHVWVIIVAADDPIYTSASLVQIAGRVGRHWKDQDGLVLFCYHRYTKQIKSAIDQIKRMNR